MSAAEYGEDYQSRNVEWSISECHLYSVENSSSILDSLLKVFIESVS
jgi:hypothetical protein